MSWEITIRANNTLHARHTRRRDNYEVPKFRDKATTLSQERPERSLFIDYISTQPQDICPCEEDYQELADITGYRVHAAIKYFTPNRSTYTLASGD